MTVHVHQLKGCTPNPLINYLKALGVLRLVSQQVDSEARAFFRDESFVLVTRLDREELETFFLDTYEPTPLISPWNKGSNLLSSDDPSWRLVEQSTDARLAPLRRGLADARALASALADADAAIRVLKDETKVSKGASRAERARAAALKDDPDHQRRLAAAERHFKQLKEGLVSSCRRQWRGRHLDWFNAAVVIQEDGKATYPALLGTGGNDGRLDYTYNTLQHLVELLGLGRDAPTQDQRLQWLRGAIWGDPTSQLVRAPVGQYSPGQAGGANSGPGPDGPSQLNPWDLPLALEGAIVFRAAASRRMTSAARIQASAPFAVRSHAVGYASASASDEGARGEQWMPLWSQPTTLGELERIVAEGRAQVGRRPAERTLDLARAIGRLGVSRGLNAFERYGYLQRNGQSNLAVPLGRLYCASGIRRTLSDEVAPWMDRLHRAARSDQASARLVQAERRLSEAVWSALTSDDRPELWQSLLRSAAAVEAAQASGTGFEAGPIPPLSPDWAVASDDGTPEFRLAVSLGLAQGEQPSDSLRRHWLPLDNGKYALEGTRLRREPAVVAFGRDAASDCAQVVMRRLIEGAQSGRQPLAIRAAPRASASSRDLALLLSGQLDLEKTVELARAFMAIDRKKWRASEVRAVRRASGSPDMEPEPSWVAIRLALCCQPVLADRVIGPDPSILRRLLSGDTPAAVDTALARLGAVGIRAVIKAGACAPARAHLWAAALAFPVSSDTVQRLVTELDPAHPMEKPNAQ